MGHRLKLFQRKIQKVELAQLMECLPTKVGRAPGFNSQYHIKPGMVMHAQAAPGMQKQGVVNSRSLSAIEQF